MMNLRMRHYVTRTPDGLIHVQNTVMGYLGQHHVHTKEQFEEWIIKEGNIVAEDIFELEGKSCDCGLKAGEMR